MVAFIQLLKILFPFLKEWLFDKKTFKAWLKRNFATLFMLILLLLMFYTLERMLQHVMFVKKQYSELKTANNDLLRQRKWLSQRYEAQSKIAKTLMDENRNYQSKVSKYEHWMAACGMNYLLEEVEMPTCSNGRSVTNSSSSRPTSTTRPPASRPTRRPPRTTRTPQSTDNPDRKPTSPNSKETQTRIRELWGQKQ